MVQSYVVSTNTLLGMADEDDASRGMQAADTASAPPPKRPKLYTKSAVIRTSSCLQQIKKYVDLQDIDDESLTFWQKTQTQTSPALRALSVPASSAVERVFSHGGSSCGHTGYE